MYLIQRRVLQEEKKLQLNGDTINCDFFSPDFVVHVSRQESLCCSKKNSGTKAQRHNFWLGGARHITDANLGQWDGHPSAGAGDPRGGSHGMAW